MKDSLFCDLCEFHGHHSFSDTLGRWGMGKRYSVLLSPTYWSFKPVVHTPHPIILSVINDS